MDLESAWRILRMRYLNRQLTDLELQAPDPDEMDDLTAADLVTDLQNRTPTRFLEFFSRGGLLKLAFQMGVVKQLQDKGFRPRLRITEAEPRHYLLRVYDRKQDADNLLIELSVHREYTIPGEDIDLPREVFPFLVIDWMLMQNPRKPFSHERPPFYGQKHPGLGVGNEIGEVLLLVAERLRLAGMLTFPAHYHNGVLYKRRLSFLNPKNAGELKALRRDLNGYSLSDQSWAVAEGCVMHADGTPYKWKAPEMLYALHPTLLAYVKSPKYKEAAEREMKLLQFTVDWKRLAEILEKRSSLLGR